jgi:hypothetical protein
VTVTVVRSAEPRCIDLNGGVVPCPTGEPVAVFANGSAVPQEGPPSYVIGAGTLRLSVAHSVEQAEEQQRKLERLLEGKGWRFHVWRTRSGKDERVRARVQAEDVDPIVGDMLCAWLEKKGWHAGAVPCEMRRPPIPERGPAQ